MWRAQKPFRDVDDLATVMGVDRQTPAKLEVMLQF
jgi:hypothetical protein